MLAVPSSSTSSERSWSLHDFILTKRRNRLDPVKVEKLAFLYSNTGSKKPVQPSFYQARRLTETDEESASGESVTSDADSDGSTERLTRCLASAFNSLSSEDEQEAHYSYDEMDEDLSSNEECDENGDTHFPLNGTRVEVLAPERQVTSQNVHTQSTNRSLAKVN